jgi:3D (Asp-Asp-Asp) domain-containing protein
MRVDLLQSRELIVRTADTILKLRTTQSAVGLALAEAGIAIQGLDYSQPALDSVLPGDGNVRITRVEEQVNLETEALPYETEYQPVPDLEVDKQSVVQGGTYGIIARRLRIRLEDGKEIARQVEAEFIAQEPKSRILGYGTKIVPQTINISGATLTYWRALNMYAVSYNPSSAGGTITASGLPLQKGVAAVDPAYIPLGTRLFIPGYGEAIAADTGGGVKGRIIDLGYSDHDYEAWHQWVTVYFMWPPPESVAWVIP